MAGDCGPGPGKGGDPGAWDAGAGGQICLHDRRHRGEDSFREDGPFTEEARVNERAQSGHPGQRPQGPEPRGGSMKAGRMITGGADCWLSRPGTADGAHLAGIRSLRTFFAAGGGPVMRSAVEELSRGLREMAGITPARVRSAAGAAVVMGTAAELAA